MTIGSNVVLLLQAFHISIICFNPNLKQRQSLLTRKIFAMLVHNTLFRGSGRYADVAISQKLLNCKQAGQIHFALEA
jgi:hypothetical protein